MDFEDFLSLLRAFEQHGVDYVLVGAAPLSVHIGEGGAEAFGGFGHGARLSVGCVSRF